MSNAGQIDYFSALAEFFFVCLLVRDLAELWLGLPLHFLVLF